MRRATETTPGRVALLVSAHVLDPSSLQDDDGAAERSIGIVQVVTGLVLLVGLLFTFVAESFASSLERLGQSDRPTRAHAVALSLFDAPRAAELEDQLAADDGDS
ncbi:MAG TPA: hypothetical protein VFT10_01940 [Solirubrobacterales bacterium]|nr:hypothetical protein [Solirubrobacterales bacterium]